MTQTIQYLRVDSITEGIFQLIAEMESYMGMGNLLNKTQPIALVIYDVLKAIGLPENAIEIAMADYYMQIDGNNPQGEKANCIYCGEAAIASCPTGSGYRLVCATHMHQLALKMVSYSKPIEVEA